MVNSFILFNLTRKEKGLGQTTHLNYRRRVIKALVGDYVTEREPTRKRSRTEFGDAERLNGLFHGFGKFDPLKTRDCVVCSDRKAGGAGRKQTSFCCKTCPSNPAIHPECFIRYHTRSKYRNDL